MSEMKKLIAILTENTAGSVASVSSEVGKSPLKRSKDTIFAEKSEQTECAADTTSSPSNFGLWKNSASLSTEQRNKHGRKHSTVDRSVMYPQLSEAAFKQRGQEYMDNSERALKSRERNAGLNEPDESPASYDGGKYSDLGTWHFKYDDGSLVMRGGKPLLTVSRSNADDIVAHASKAGHNIKIVAGAPRNELGEADYSPRKFPEDMADYTDDDWDAWDAMVSRIGQSAKNHDKRQNPSNDSGDEKINEISTDALKNYKRTSSGDVTNRQNIANRTGRPDAKIAKRNAGQDRAEQKLQKKGSSVDEAKTPQEFMKQISQPNPKILDSGHVDIDLTPREWSLYASGMDCRKVAVELNRVFNNAANAPDATRSSVGRVVQKTMEKYSKYGAYDTASREVLGYLLDKYLPEDDEVGEGLGEDKNKSVPSSTPRNFVAKNAKTAGAGAHKDKKHLAKKGDVKHKSQRYEFAETETSEWTVTIDAIDHGVLSPVTVSAGSANEAKQNAIARVKASMSKRGYELDVRSVSAKPMKAVAEDTGDKKFDDMMKRVAKKPTQAQRKVERIRQQKEREAETKAHFANGGGFGPSPADKLSIRKEGVAEGTVIYGEPENKESFKVTYYDPKYDEQRTSTIKARNETAALDYCGSKGYDVIDIQRQGVAEGSEITEEMIADRLKDELALFKSGTKAKDKAISKKPADKEVQPKKSTKKDSE